jgi:putative oxidoreductase
VNFGDSLDETKGRAHMKIFTVIIRVLLGLIFTIFGLNGFFHFLPTPPLSGLLGEMMSVYLKMGYMFPLIFATQIVGGILLLTNMYVALGLLLLAPVIVNIVLVHVFIDPAGLPVALFVLFAELFLAFSYRHKFAPILKAK